MNGILCAYLRATTPSTPKVDATALQPPSIASLTMFSGSKYCGFGAKLRAGGVLDALVDRQDREVAGAAEPAVVEQPLRLRITWLLRSVAESDADRRSPARQVQVGGGDRLALVLEQSRGVVAQQFGYAIRRSVDVVVTMRS